MLAAVVVVAVLLAVWTLVGAGWVLASRTRLPVRRRMMVNMLDGSAADGVLVDRRGGHLVLQQVTLHSDGQQVPLDGQVLVPRERVAFLQVVGG